MKISYREAIQRRLRRVYLVLLVLVLVAWIFRITVLSLQSWLDSAAFGPIPGSVTIGVVGLFYLAALAVTVWPMERRAKGESDDVEEGAWKETD